ncbi:MAG: hypothetical protein CVT62_12670 [Actinobacteria bacterium HGW-Actinobacteria-2]|nr:MAG: hypothetical protein CVT62_12670 [Actinobacteria bacterium HGW-Actinobacteria-2]
MAMKLAALLAQPALRLAVRCPGGEDALAAVVQWVHQSELSDSTLFTEPGEILLTTGSHLPDPATVSAAELTEACRDYVRRLNDSHVVGLGFGVGVHHDTSPAPLVAAAYEFGLPLFEIPYEIPFSAVIKAVSKSLSDSEHAYLRRTNSAQRRLITAVGRPQVQLSVARSTAQIIGGWAALTDPKGQVLVASPGAPVSAAEAAAASHLSCGQQVSFPAPNSGKVCAHSVMNGDGGLLAILITAAEAELDPLAISTSMLAANLLGIHLSVSERLEGVLAGLRAPLMREVLAGRTEMARQFAGSLWPKLPREPLALSCLSGPAEVLAAITPEMPAVWGQVDDRLWVVTNAGHVRALSAAAARQPQVSFGSAPAESWDGLPAAKHRTLNALLAGRAGGLDLLDLLPPEQALAFAHARLGDLLLTENAELRETVRCWADCDGSFDRTATTLNVHRHTVRRRLQRVEEILGVGLEEARLRRELWFACQVIERNAQASLPSTAGGSAA